MHARQQQAGVLGSVQPLDSSCFTCQSSHMHGKHYGLPSMQDNCHVGLLCMEREHVLNAGGVMSCVGIQPCTLLCSPAKARR